jgi:hypothetical protein
VRGHGDDANDTVRSIDHDESVVGHARAQIGGGPSRPSSPARPATPAGQRARRSSPATRAST